MLCCWSGLSGGVASVADDIKLLINWVGLLAADMRRILFPANAVMCQILGLPIAVCAGVLQCLGSLAVGGLGDGLGLGMECFVNHGVQMMLHPCSSVLVVIKI
ncbi:hypothetical protein U1Q18_000545 [Sarracenia purpurea var. burkii]